MSETFDIPFHQLFEDSLLLAKELLIKKEKREPSVQELIEFLYEIEWFI